MCVCMVCNCVKSFAEDLKWSKFAVSTTRFQEYSFVSTYYIKKVEKEKRGKKLKKHNKSDWQKRRGERKNEENWERWRRSSLFFSASLILLWDSLCVWTRCHSCSFGKKEQERDPFTDLRRLLQSSDLTLTGMLSDLDWITSKKIPLWHEERL